MNLNLCSNVSGVCVAGFALMAQGVNAAYPVGAGVTLLTTEDQDGRSQSCRGAKPARRVRGPHAPRGVWKVGEVSHDQYKVVDESDRLTEPRKFRLDDGRQVTQTPIDGQSPTSVGTRWTTRIMKVKCCKGWESFNSEHSCSPRDTGISCKLTPVYLGNVDTSISCKAFCRPNFQLRVVTHFTSKLRRFKLTSSEWDTISSVSELVGNGQLRGSSNSDGGLFIDADMKPTETLITKDHGSLFEKLVKGDWPLETESIKVYNVEDLESDKDGSHVVELEMETPMPLFNRVEAGDNETDFKLGSIKFGFERPGGLKEGDHILQALYSDSAQKISVNDINAFRSREECDRAKKIVHEGVAGLQVSNARKILFVVLRDTQTTKLEKLRGFLSRVLSGVGCLVLSPAEILYAASAQPDGHPTLLEKAELQKQKRTKMAIICGICVVILVVIVGVGSAMSSGPHDYTLPTEHNDESSGGDVGGVPVSRAAIEAKTPIEAETPETPIMSVGAWSIVEMLLGGFGLVAGLSIAFAVILNDLEHAGRLGSNERMNCGAALFVAAGLCGKGKRAKYVFNKFPKLSQALAFFLVQEACVMLGSALFGMMCGLCGLDFRPRNCIGSCFYACLIVGEVYGKCKLVIFAADSFEHFKGFESLLSGLSKKFIVGFFVVLHLFLDTIQQILAVFITQIAQFFAGKVGPRNLSSWVSDGFSWVSDCFPAATVPCCSTLNSGLSCVFQVVDWLFHLAVTIPALEGRFCLAGSVRDMKADKAAAGNVAVEMLVRQLSGNYSIVA